MITSIPRAYRYTLASGDFDEAMDDMELSAAEHTEGVVAELVVHNATDDDDHVYELAGVGRGVVPAGVMNVTCVASRTSVKKATAHALISMSGDVDNNNDNDNASPPSPTRTNVHPTVLGREDYDNNESSADMIIDLDNDVYDMSGAAANEATRAPDVDSGPITFAYPPVLDGVVHLADVDEDVYDVGAAGDTYDTRTTSDTDPTYEVVGAINPEDESQS